MKMTNMKCPNCDAEISCVDGLDTFFCQYCGAKLMIDGMSDSGYAARVKIKEFEHKERAQKVKYEHDERRQKAENDIERYRLKSKERASFFKSDSMYLLIVMAMFAFIFIGIESTGWGHKGNVRKLEKKEKQIQELINDEKYEEAKVALNGLKLTDNYSSDETKMWDEKRSNYLSLISNKEADIMAAQNKISPPASYDYFVGKAAESAKTMFKDAGFTNIEIKESPERAGFFDSQNSVEHISVGGRVDYSSSDYFDVNTVVTIYFYK